MSDFWVFGYGSLMWNPGFPVVERQQAKMHGVHRALCVRSWVHRGTQECPGLVLGLDRGGSCHGMAFRVAGADRDQVITYLRERELVTRVYIECWRQVRFADGGAAEALVYVVDRSHEQYAGKLAPGEIAAIVTQGCGKSGLNIDYFANTLAHLRELGIADPHLETVARHLPQYQAAARPA